MPAPSATSSAASTDRRARPPVWGRNPPASRPFARRPPPCPIARPFPRSNRRPAAACPCCWDPLPGARSPLPSFWRCSVPAGKSLPRLPWPAEHTANPEKVWQSAPVDPRAWRGPASGTPRRTPPAAQNGSCPGCFQWRAPSAAPGIRRSAFRRRRGPVRGHDALRFFAIAQKLFLVTFFRGRAHHVHRVVEIPRVQCEQLVPVLERFVVLLCRNVIVDVHLVRHQGHVTLRAAGELVNQRQLLRGIGGRIQLSHGVVGVGPRWYRHIFPDLLCGTPRRTPRQ